MHSSNCCSQMHPSCTHCYLPDGCVTQWSTSSACTCTQHAPALSIPRVHSIPERYLLCRTPEAGAGTRQLTLRAVVIGLLVGSILCFSNTYFGLQTGWVTMGSLQVRAASPAPPSHHKSIRCLEPP